MTTQQSSLVLCSEASSIVNNFVKVGIFTCKISLKNLWKESKLSSSLKRRVKNPNQILAFPGRVGSDGVELTES